MVQYDQLKVEKDVLEFCRYPVPRTPADIVRYLKQRHPDFYAKTPVNQVVKFVRKDVLVKLVSNSHFVQYLCNDNEWNKTRKLISYYFSKQVQNSPRKLTEAYQVNFLYLSDDALTFKLPSFKEINLDLNALLYPLTSARTYSNFSLNLLNLIYCYSKEETRDRIRIELYRLNFDDKEKNLLERMLEVSSNNDSMKAFFGNFPFQPNIEKALDFMTEL